jgi:diacylglycerol kinase (ATP)
VKPRGVENTHLGKANLKSKFFAVVNPAAGGGRCGKLAPAAIDGLRRAGLTLEVATSTYPGHGTKLAAEAYAAGHRNFVAVGGDGTSYEIVNGIFSNELSGQRPALGFLPLGTGNSFLKDFTSNAAEDAAAALTNGKWRHSDLLRLVHENGEIYSINLVTLGFAADVAALANRRFKRLGELGYIMAVMVSLARLDRRAFPLRTDSNPDFDRRPCLFLSFNNSKFTGGKMMIAPNASPEDGLIEYVRWGPIGRLGLIRNFPTLFDGTHVRHPLAARSPQTAIEFEMSGPDNVSVDGESLWLRCQRIEIIPAALDVLI